MSNPGERDAVVPGLTGWLFTDAVNQVACPKCGEKAGQDCRTPKKRKAWPPHDARTAALTAKVGTAPFTHTVKHSDS